MSTYVKKTYNTHPARFEMVLSPSRRSYLAKDKDKCSEKGFDALDFVLWYDQTLLDSGISLAQPPFDFVLQCVDKGVIHTSKISNPFRLACLIFNVFANSEAASVKRISANFLKENPNFFDNEKQEAYRSVDFNKIYSYDRVAANKVMFPHFSSKGIEKALIAELISRQLLAFDDKRAYKNIVYVCQDVAGQKLGCEVCGMTAKPFMQLLGKAYPFVYYRDEVEQLHKEDFERIEFFGDTLEMLQELSALYRSEDGIPSRVLYASLHKNNYSEEAYRNFREQFANLEEVWHCDCKAMPQSKVAPATPIPTVAVDAPKPTIYHSDKKFSTLPSEPVSADFVPFTEAQLREMKQNNQLTEDYFALAGEDEESIYSFEDIVKMKQHPYYGNKIVCFVDENGDEFDVFGRSMLPF